MPAPPPTRHLGDRYTLGALLGTGGTAQVYQARDALLGVERAIKLIHVATPAVRDALRRRLRIEARAMARLAHPNILRIYDIGLGDEHDYVVMELAEGGSLAGLLDARGAMPVNDALGYSIQILSALAAAHAAGIVHRDVKPQNVLLDRNGVAQLADFGIALFNEEEFGRSTRAGVAMGSLSFMAPEQRLDARSVGAQADIYAAGASLYNLLTNSNPVDLFTALPDSPRWMGVRPDLAAVIQRATRLEPSERYSDAREMAIDLLAALQVTDTDTRSLPRQNDPSLFPMPNSSVALPSTAGASQAQEALAAANLPDAVVRAATFVFADLPSPKDGHAPTLHEGPDLDNSLSPWSIDDSVAPAEGAGDRAPSGRPALAAQQPGAFPAPRQRSWEARAQAHPQRGAAPRGAGWRVAMATAAALLPLAIGLGLAWQQTPLPNPGNGIQAAPTPPRPTAVGQTPEEGVAATVDAGARFVAATTAAASLPAPGARPGSEANAAATGGAPSLEKTAEAPPEASAAVGPAPLGTWHVSFGGRRAELRLRGASAAPQGELRVMFDGNAVDTKVAGGWDADARVLTLRDLGDAPDGGDYTLQYNAALDRFEGAFVTRDGSRKLQMTGWRPN